MLRQPPPPRSDDPVRPVNPREHTFPTSHMTPIKLGSVRAGRPRWTDSDPRAPLSPGPALGSEDFPSPFLQLRGQRWGGRQVGLGVPWWRCTSLTFHLVRRFIQKPPVDSSPRGKSNDCYPFLFNEWPAAAQGRGGFGWGACSFPGPPRQRTVVPAAMLHGDSPLAFVRRSRQ